MSTPAPTPTSPDNQIRAEYNRVLDQYTEALRRVQRVLEAELAAIATAREQGLRFNVRHAMLEFADAVTATDIKMRLFSQFSY